MKNYRIEEENSNRAKIINLKDYTSYYTPCLITVKKVKKQAQNFKNKIIKQSYVVDFLPNLPGLYTTKPHIYVKKMSFQNFENSDLFYMYNINGQKRGGYPIYYIKNELKILNKEIFKLRKTTKPLELLPQLFENLWDKDYKSRVELHSYYGPGGGLHLTETDYEKGYKIWFYSYLHIWRDFIFNIYKAKVINLSLETLNKYNAYGLCKLQSLLDLSELGYITPYKNNPLENLFYYIKKESEYKTPLGLEEFKKKQAADFFFYLKNYVEKNQQKNFLEGYLENYESNKFEGTPYSFQAVYNGFDYLNKLHSLQTYYQIFGLILKNKFGLSHFGQKHLYLQYYIYTEGPCLTASLELQKIKNLNIAGKNLKKNSIFFKMSLEQISFVFFAFSATIWL